MNNIGKEDYDKLKTASLRNIIKKINSGSFPTRQEWEFLNEAKSGGEAIPDNRLDGLQKSTKSDSKMRVLIISQFGISERKSYSWLDKLKHLKKNGIWPVKDVLSVIQERKDNANTGANNDLKRELLQEQIDLMKVRRQTVEKELINKDVVRDMFSGIAQIYNSGLEQFVSYVTAEFDDKAVLKASKRIVNDVRDSVDVRLKKLKADHAEK